MRGPDENRGAREKENRDGIDERKEEKKEINVVYQAKEKLWAKSGTKLRYIENWDRWGSEI